MTEPTREGGAPVNPRHAAMQQIAANARANTAEDMQTFDEETGEVQAKEEPEQLQVETQTEATQQQTQQTTQEEPAKPKMAVIVVNGQQIEVEESRLLEAGRRTLQKESAADRRLQDAAELEKRARAMLERAQQLSPGDAATPSQDASTQTHEPATDSAPSFDAILDAKLYNRDAQRAAVQFKDEFKEIAADPFLMSIAAKLEDERLATAAALGEPLGDPFEAYRSHGNRINEWLGKQRPQTTNKQDLKRNTMAITGANARAPLPTEKKPPTHSERIDAMREQRSRGRSITH